MQNKQQLMERIEKIRVELNLNFDEYSVFLLENEIDVYNEQTKNNNYYNDKIVFEYGLFFGQCLINVYGGNWMLDPATKKLKIKIKPYLIIDPFQAIRYYFKDNFNNASFYIFFKSLSHFIPKKNNN